MVKLYEAITYIGDWQVVPGEVFERDIPQEQEAWLLRAGAIRVAELIPDLECGEGMEADPDSAELEQKPAEGDLADSEQEKAAEEDPEEAAEEDPEALATVAAVDCADAVGTRKSSGRRKRA